MNVSRPAAAAIAACLLLALGACDHSAAKNGSEEAAGPKKREPARVRTAPVEQREMVKTLSTTTVLESEHEVKIVPRSVGIVTELKAEEGDRVTAGAVLAVLDRRLTLAMVEDAKVAVREAEDSVSKADIAKSESESRIITAQIKYDQTVRDYDRNAKANLISAQALDNLSVLRDTAKNELETAKISAQSADIATKAVRTSLEKAKLALGRAELDDAYRQITAPFDGVIASRSIREGDMVGPSSSVFVLTDVGNLRAIVYRPQRELPMFLAACKRIEDCVANGTKPDGDHPAGTVEGASSAVAPGPAEDVTPGADARSGDRAIGALEIRASPEALPGSVFRGELQLVSPSIDPQSGSFRVTVRMGAPIEGPKDARLLPGMLVRLEIVTERHPDALVVPKRALRREGEQNLVFRFDDGKARRMEVVEGYADDASVEIRSASSDPITAGMRVIVVGNRELEDGADVTEEEAALDTQKSPPPAEPKKG